MRTSNQYKHYTTTQIWHIMNNMRRRTRDKGIELTVSVNDIKQLVHDFCETHYYCWDTKSPFKPSVDRIDPNKGYNLDNIKICWLIENYCKNVFTEEDVLKFCKLKLEL